MHRTSNASELVATCALDTNLSLTTFKNESRVDSRLLAKHLGNQHRHVIALIKKFAEPFATFGKVLFEKASSAVSITGQRERFALLNEDQAFFLLTMSRNSDHVVGLKVKLVQAFSDARRLAEQRKTEYLPTYYRLHDTLHQLAAQSANEKFVHMNLNKLVNKTAGLEAGQRPKAGLSQQAMVIVAQVVAIKCWRLIQYCVCKKKTTHFFGFFFRSEIFIFNRNENTKQY